MTVIPNVSELIARAIIIDNEKILLCKSKKRGHYFLPGGHVEFGEKTEEALKREFIEETGSEVKIGKFVGAFENIFGQEQKYHEVCLVFTASLLHSDKEIVSKEDHIEYARVGKEEFASSNFLPKFMKEVVLNFWTNNETFWVSEAD